MSKYNQYMNNLYVNSKIELDQLDRVILNEVQQDNLQSHATIGEKVGLSTSSVRRRLERLRKWNVISKDVTLLNRNMAGITLIVTVTFEKESQQLFQQFEKQMNALPEVGQCYHISGDKDYLLVVGVPSLQYYESWGMKHLMSNSDIKRYDTIVTYSCKKFDTKLAL